MASQHNIGVQKNLEVRDDTHFGGGAANSMKRTKKAKKKKIKMSNSVDKANHKEESATKKNPDMNKEETMLETGNQLNPAALPHENPAVNTGVHINLVRTDGILHTSEAAQNTVEGKKVAEEKIAAEEKKNKQNNDEDNRVSKEKLETNENPSVTSEEPTLDSDNLFTPTSLSHIPLETLTDIETQLVYTDEEDIAFEFAKSTSTQAAYHNFGKADTLRAPHGSALPCIDQQLQKTLHQASSCYRQNHYKAAVEHFSAALKLCGEGYATGNHLESYPEDISSIASFIEAKLAICYLKLKKPGDALDHAHRSITLNPANFQNHLRQAAAFRCLERYSEAARSTMIAEYMYCLTGGTDQHTSKLIKLYWQAMIEEAITDETSFSVMYTPFLTRVKDDIIKKIEKMFAKKHPHYVQHIYTDPHEFHILPQTSDWLALPPQQYLLTVGFRNKHIGKLLESYSKGKLTIFSAQKAPFNTLTKEEAVKFWGNTGKKIMSVVDFVRSTKLTDDRCPCSRGLEKLQYASLLGCMQRGREQSQVINQAMAELATIPYLQDISHQDVNLLQTLMADAMDILGGVRNDNECVWSKIQKIGLVQNILYEAEDAYLKKRKRPLRVEGTKRPRSSQQHYELRTSVLYFTTPNVIVPYQNMHWIHRSQQHYGLGNSVLHFFSQNLL